MHPQSYISNGYHLTVFFFSEVQQIFVTSSFQVLSLMNKNLFVLNIKQRKEKHDCSTSGTVIKGLKDASDGTPHFYY